MQEFILNPADNNLPGLDVAPKDWVLGGEQPDIELCDIQIRVAEQPLAFNYFQLCQLEGKTLSPELALLYKRYDLWLIKHSVSIIDRSQTCNVIEFGYQCVYDEDYKVQIREMMPQTAFIKPALTGGFAFHAEVGAGGEAKIPQTDIDLGQAKAGGHGDLKISSSANLGIDLSFPVLAPLVQAIGQNSRFGEWLIKKDQQPLVGDQILTQVLIVDKGLMDLKFRSKVYVTVKRFGILNSRRESNWIDLACELA